MFGLEHEENPIKRRFGLRFEDKGFTVLSLTLLRFLPIAPNGSSMMCPTSSVPISAQHTKA